MHGTDPKQLAQALGRDDSHLVSVLPDGVDCPLHAGVVEPFLCLQQAAAEHGFRIRIVSGWRSFEHQCRIWNGKACGERPVLDDHGCVVDWAALDDAQRVQAILRWSALPGASRHHWGTDMDVIDASVLPEGYRVQLTVDEARGLFSRFHAWLDERIATDTAFGFYRPYDRDRGGVAPEPWHLSYRPLAENYAACITPQSLADNFHGQGLLLDETVLAGLPELYARFVRVIDA